MYYIYELKTLFIYTCWNYFKKQLKEDDNDDYV